MRGARLAGACGAGAALLALITLFAVWDHGRFASQHERARVALARSATTAARLDAARQQLMQLAVDGAGSLEDVAAGIPALLDAMPPSLPGRAPAARAGEGFDTLRGHWAQIAEVVDGLLAGWLPALALTTDAERLQRIAGELLVTSDELVERLIAAEAEPAQLRAAARQMVLIQRIVTNMQRALEPDRQVLTAVDRLGRDSMVFGEVATALLNGSTDLRVGRVEDPEARELLVSVGREFRALAQSVEAVMRGAASRAELRREGERLVGVLDAIVSETAALESALAARAHSRLLRAEHVLLLASSNALAVIAALALASRQRTRRRREARERDERQRAQLTELDARRIALRSQVEEASRELHRMADGDLALRARIERPSEGDAAGLFEATDRLRHGLREQVDEVLKLLRGGALLGELGAQLEDAARRQQRQTENAGQATRAMVGALEGLRNESAQVGDAARACALTTESASRVLSDVVADLDAVRAATEDGAERVRRLEDAARELRPVRTLVEDVSELGKLLSLNVAIQASLGGEAGAALGAFSDEAQRLSERARQALSRIDAVHEELRSEAGRAAGAVKESAWRARSAVDRARGAGGGIDAMRVAAKELDSLSQAAARVQREHAVQVTEVVKGVTALAALASEVCERVDRAVDTVSAVAAAGDGLERRLAAPQAARSPAVIDLARPEHELDAGDPGMSPRSRVDARAALRSTDDERASDRIRIVDRSG